MFSKSITEYIRSVLGRNWYMYNNFPARSPSQLNVTRNWGMTYNEMWTNINTNCNCHKAPVGYKHYTVLILIVLIHPKHACVTRQHINFLLMPIIILISLHEGKKQHQPKYKLTLSIYNERESLLFIKLLCLSHSCLWEVINDKASFQQVFLGNLI